MPRRSGRASVVFPALLLVACSGPQSAIDPAGPAASSILRLGVLMFVIAGVVAVLVTVLMLIPFLRRGQRPVNRRLFLWGGGVALPLVTLTALMPYVMGIGEERRAAPFEGTLAIDITGSQYWWEMSYREGESAPIVSANELRLPAGEEVEILLRSNDVIHSFWVPNLAGKTDLVPGRVNRMLIEADQPGIYRGQCAEYCGRQHALMAFDVIVMPREEFDVWLAGLAQPRGEPATDELREGRDLFLSLGCATCHTIRGVSEGQLGPDLTGVGGRLSIGAGAVQGGLGGIMGWIASAQHIKPGNAMPSFDELPGPQLRALGSYLASLR